MSWHLPWRKSPAGPDVTDPGEDSLYIERETDPLQVLEPLDLSDEVPAYVDLAAQQRAPSVEFHATDLSTMPQRPPDDYEGGTGELDPLGALGKVFAVPGRLYNGIPWYIRWTFIAGALFLVTFGVFAPSALGWIEGLFAPFLR